MNMTENIAYACLTKNCTKAAADTEILRWIQNDLSVTGYSFKDFENQSNQYASVLSFLHINPKETVSIYLPRSPELISLFFAILKNLAISCVLFSTLGEDALLDRLSDSQTRILITKKSLLRKVLSRRDKLDSCCSNRIFLPSTRRHGTTRFSPVHLRLDRKTQGRFACAWRFSGHDLHVQRDPGSQKKRALLVHSRSRLDHRVGVWDHRPFRNHNPASPIFRRLQCQKLVLNN
jgi:hypothetical protein